VGQGKVGDFVPFFSVQVPFGLDNEWRVFVLDIPEFIFMLNKARMLP
jgi:hypothetical protein